MGRFASLFASLALMAAAASGVAQAADADAPASPFWTKHAYFVPARFGDLPGWRGDDLRDAWRAFRQSCGVLGRRPAWSEPCARAAAVRPGDSDDVRRFLEREFVLYQIHNKDRSADGVITGYYEPLLSGSRRYGQGFVHPVYAVPDTLLFLDARSIPAVVDGSPVFARVEGRNVIPVCPDGQVRAACLGPYRLDLGGARPDVRDKKVRVRIEGDRIVPYYTRAEIEQGALRDGPVLLWVNDAAALYSMQVQGSGKVRLTDGQIVRLAYGEQNGHPFNPPVRNARRSMLTRSVGQPDEDDEDDVLSNEERTAPVLEVLTRGARPAVDPPPKQGEETLTPEVARMVDLLMKGTGSAAPTTVTAATAPAAAAAPAPPKPASATASEPAVVARPAAGSQERPSVGYFSPGPSTYTVDPSYVFFRQIPDSDQGPLGALGVPLTAGRSVAVDPRTTPLGFPVFLSTGGAASINRLVLAQDTGGAIRGPVRADYFWGFGPGAYAQASRMKENGRMWLLMPKGLSASLASGNVLTRSASGATEKECLVADPEFCVE